MIDFFKNVAYVKFSPLLTDWLFYFLIVMMFCFFLSIHRNATLLEPWKKVIQKPLNMAVILLLSAFVLVTTLDSVHVEIFPNHPMAKNYPNTYGAGQTRSLLDFFTKEAIEHQETSYSAPFALFAFTKENVTQNAKITRDYPRLHYAGQHLKKESEKYKDIILKLGYAVLQALSLFILIIGLGWLYQKIRFKHAVKKTHGIKFPIKTFLGMLYFLLFLGSFISIMMPYYHIMGTSKVGQDVLYEALKSIRTGVLIGTLTTLVMLPFALLLGILAGYLRGWIDDVIQYLYTTLSSIPGVLLIAASVLSLQVLMTSHQDWFSSMAQRSDARLLALCVILGVTSWTGLCRLLRGEALKLREVDYVLAARSLGVSHFKIMLKHLLPNMSHIILISIALDFSGLVLAEAVLSYIGVGVDPSAYSWGTMINGARLEMSRMPVVWWSLTAAFVFMFTLVLSANIFADSLRDAFDPRMRDQK